MYFSLGDTDEEEIRNVFAILNYIAENNIEIHLGVAFGYSSSKISRQNQRIQRPSCYGINSPYRKILNQDRN